MMLRSASQAQEIYKVFERPDMAETISPGSFGTSAVLPGM
jgi:hypothetical protein